MLVFVILIADNCDDATTNKEEHNDDSNEGGDVGVALISKRPAAIATIDNK